MRLIDADKLIRDIEYWKNDSKDISTPEQTSLLESFITKIAYQPTLSVGTDRNSTSKKEVSLIWEFEKFKGMGGIYAICPKCDYKHLASNGLKQEVCFNYNYCPICGEYLKVESDDVDVIWNERDMNVLLFQKEGDA